ncbi:MAG: protein translocase subunit SecD [Pseudomonadota bacterium]
MLHFSPVKIATIIVICLLGLLGGVPNFFAKDTVETWPNVLPKSQITLGLDLQGGAHLLLAMNVKELQDDWLKTIAGDARAGLRRARIATRGRPAVAGDFVRVRLRNVADAEKAMTTLNALRQQVGNVLLGTQGFDLTVTNRGDGIITLTPTSLAINERTTNAIGAAIETLRRRLDGLGTTEPSIVRQGRDRILVQYPGIKGDKIARLKNIIGKTAKMTFHLVHPTITAQEAAQTRVPLGYKLVRSVDEGGGQELIATRAMLSGEDLVDSQPSFDQRNQQPIITFRFNQRGARIFGRVTRDNVRRRFAIVLDNEVISAPVINEPILGGAGQISGAFTVQQTNDLALQLRSGALPATLTIVEERTVGPSLGADSITAGIWAAAVGALLVAAFILYCYGFFGVFALIAVFLNLSLVVAMMSWLGATLTLPGIAGLVLTVGMAVDANVLIYERIREEQRNKKTPIMAIEAGYNRALGTIIDSNVTTLIAGVVMFWLGSGPIRGFAVTLSLGILTTVFTAFTVTRMLVALWVASQHKKSRTIPQPI